MKVNGARRAWLTVATNSDFIKSSSLKWVTSRRTHTCPRMEPSAPMMGEADAYRVRPLAVSRSPVAGPAAVLGPLKQARVRDGHRRLPGQRGQEIDFGFGEGVRLIVAQPQRAVV